MIGNDRQTTNLSHRFQLFTQRQAGAAHFFGNHDDRGVTADILAEAVPAELVELVAVGAPGNVQDEDIL